MAIDESAIRNFQEEFDGEFLTDLITRKLYSTDASPYQQLPAAVAIPKSESDVERLIILANHHAVGLIPRTAGTSLAGQVVGNGIVVDVSRHLNQVGDVDPSAKTVWVQPGVIRNELNMVLAEHGLFFGPETSTSNRAMIGGMLGNNSCGSNSIVYGTTRDQVLEIQGFMSDGSRVSFHSVDSNTIEAKTRGDSLESKVYQHVRDLLSDENAIRQIADGFPKRAVTRRNTGYALDELVRGNQDDKDLNLCKLIAGSEGTLFFATQIKLQCHDLPPRASALLCAHFESIDHSLQAAIVAMQHRPFACELMDRLILEGASRNIEQRSNMDFVDGMPEAILVLEMRSDSTEEAIQACTRITHDFQNKSLGYHFPVLTGDETKKVWSLRRAGLGVVANVPGDAKPVTVIEDTAVALADLPEYIRELNQLLRETYGAECVHYAHAGAGELHLRPVLNLKTEKGRKQFRQIATDVAGLVKKYSGSLSGEHGDGRLRGEFISEMIGKDNYQRIVEMKRVWDPDNIFNPGKIIDAPPMDTGLRAKPAIAEPHTEFRYGAAKSILGAAEMCSGSGDCRKTHLSGGTMCPSYMATRNESDTTRARANILRHVLTNSESSTTGTNAAKSNLLASDEIHSVMSLCLSCKGCKSECPSNVDVARLKAEAQNAFHQQNGIPLRTRLIAGHARANRWNAKIPSLFNFIARSRWLSSPLKWFAGFHPDRSLPPVSSPTLAAWFKQHIPHRNAGKKGEVFLFCDEFTNFLDAEVGIAAIELLERIGFAVEIPAHLESGRAAISKGLLKRAKTLANENVKRLTKIVSSQKPLIGIEPSAILTFRDEYPDLVDGDLRDDAAQLADNSLLIDEFLDDQRHAGVMTKADFNSSGATIRLHGHCHQKSLSSLSSTVRILQIPENFDVFTIPSGCCGMAGSFGYEAENYDLSMQIGELVLFPAIRKEPIQTMIAAPGTSCRHQIHDGTGRVALHPVQILRRAFKEN